MATALLLSPVPGQSRSGPSLGLGSLDFDLTQLLVKPTGSIRALYPRKRRQSPERLFERGSERGPRNGGPRDLRGRAATHVAQHWLVMIEKIRQPPLNHSCRVVATRVWRMRKRNDHRF